MRNFISEDDIEQAVLKKLSAAPFAYEIVRCDASPEARDDLPDGTGRTSKKQCVLPEVLKAALIRLNPDIPEDKVLEVHSELCRDYTGTDMTATNYRLYGYIREGCKKQFRRNGKDDFAFVRLVDFEHPENNTFTAVSQMWIQGSYHYSRPDVLVFVNGLPMVFIELKNSTVKVRVAYDENLASYRKNIHNLFAFNQICVLSNGLETKLGAFNAGYDYFFEWLKVASETEKPDRKQLLLADTAEDSSMRCFVDGLLDKTRLIDYIENFILFENKSVKIIAKNHQYHGVNNLMESVEHRREKKGKIGVFWHTQGSGKSYSMVFFARKVRRKLTGNFTFLIITDRDDLDGQIHKNFERTEVIGAKDETQPKNGKQLREFLQTNKPFIFTLIHKFRYDKGKEYPVLSTRDDIFVLVDEAHRTQYKDLAENMHRALPNANYIAFTGTPLLGSKRLTNQWFGDYVSEYNFAQSVEDKSTVPLFYSKPVPEVCLKNDFLDDDVLNIIEEENLNEAERKLLENSASRILEVIKREDRLDKVAKSIAHHFPRRGFLGKGMVVSVDKYTAVRMYDGVQYYWGEEKKAVMAERNAAATEEERKRLTDILAYMNRAEMAVIVSEEEDENKKFGDKNLDIAFHRQRMNAITPEGKDIEDRFKDPDDPLQLVFVCAMWLTGFDVKNLSTLYLDKPMKGHTLMQAIARANRVYPGKACGIVVDYVNIFKYMRRALVDYATGNNGDEFPVKDMEKLVENIDKAVEEMDRYLCGLGIDIGDMIAEADTLDRLDMFRAAYNKIMSSDEAKDRCKVMLNTLLNLYDAAKPEIFEMHWSNEKFPPLKYLHGLFFHTIDDEKIERARLRMAQVLDTSVTAVNPADRVEYVVHEGKVLDLSKIDTEELRKEIRTAKYKAVEIDDLKAAIERALEQMIRRNCTRRKFSERYRDIIDRYNAGGIENEEGYEQLVKLLKEMKTENVRANVEGLTEEELEIYDLLIAGKRLTKAEEQKVKLSAKNLYQKLSKNRKELLVVDWYKDEQPRERVKSTIENSLDVDLPECYDKKSFVEKTGLLFEHFIDMAVQGYGWIAA